MCASSLVVGSTERRWSTVEWRELSSPAQQVGSWLVGSRVAKRCLGLGRQLVPARRSSREDSRRDLSDSQVISATGRSYMRSLLSLLLSMSSYFTTPSVVLTSRCASCLL
ncbi:hypothetical protein B296_00044406 [Ensete ventricosum]|uniref:Uncharacterized protein n=1 Tax=Ensete ventricosum TaxID=4639 RepID=A0A426XCC1_ENSVE|nr:hypothetical protein B296_00044406 [Ensete ventricosum]